jgi:uncharacterized membrane protein
MASDAVTAVNDVLNPMNGDRSEPLRGVPSTAAVAGHPIHPMLIPYPIAFLTGVLATDLAARSSGDPFWSKASRWMLGAGIASGVLAGAVGAIDYFTIRRAREKPVGKIHVYANVAALTLSGVNLALRRGDERPGDVGVGLSAAVFGLLGLSGWAGAELSYRHMIGVAGHNDQLGHDEKQVRVD